MSNNRYIEVDSSYRNRSEYPNPAHFQVKFSDCFLCGENKDCIQFSDGVSDAYPIYGWHGLPLARRVFSVGSLSVTYNQVWPPIQNNLFSQVGAFVGGTKEQPQLGLISQFPIPAGIPRIQEDSVFQSGGSNGTVPAILNTGVSDYFAGALLGRVQNPTNRNPSLLETSRILSFNGTTGICTLLNPLSDLNISTDYYVIIFDQNITNFPSPNGVAFWPGGQNNNPAAANYNPNPTIFINGGSFSNNAYVGYYVEDISLTQNRQGGTTGNNYDSLGTTYSPLKVVPAIAKIIQYNGITRVATLDSNFGVDPTAWSPSPSPGTSVVVGSETHNYIIRKELPLIRGCVDSRGTSGGIGDGVGGSRQVLGCVYSFEMNTDANGNIITGSGYTTGIATTNSLTGTGNNLRIRILNGGSLNKNFIEIANPGIPTGGYQVGDIISITNSTPGGTEAQIRITGVGTGINLTNSDPILNANTNAFKGQYFYIPSRYPINELSSGLPFTNYPRTVPVGYGTSSNTDTTNYGPNWPNNATPGSVNATGTGGASDPTLSGQLSTTPYTYGSDGCVTRRWKSTLPPTVNINSNSTIPETGTRSILGYFYDNSGVTRSVVVTKPFLTPPGISPPDLPNNIYFEILPCHGNNENTLTYSGSMVSQQEAVCYQIGLTNLILPNVDLKFPPGGTTAFKPYLYVSLNNVSAAVNKSNEIIYSNNPNSKGALFRVAITDTPQKLITTFIKITTSAMQTVKFKPNDNLEFRVYFPDGTTFTTSASDTSPPVAPDSKLQISAEFSIQRL